MYRFYIHTLCIYVKGTVSQEIKGVKGGIISFSKFFPVAVDDLMKFLFYLEAIHILQKNECFSIVQQWHIVWAKLDA